MNCCASKHKNKYDEVGEEVSVPNEIGVAVADTAPVVVGGGVPGGVVSIPLSSIIFLQLRKAVWKKNKRHTLRNKGKCFKLECKGPNTVIYVSEQSR